MPMYPPIRFVSSYKLAENDMIKQPTKIWLQN